MQILPDDFIQIIRKWFVMFDTQYSFNNYFHDIYNVWHYTIYIFVQILNIYGIQIIAIWTDGEKIAQERYERIPSRQTMRSSNRSIGRLVE